MSTIMASCTDQTLRLTNTPVIASGGVNEDYITFEFCDLWNGFAKTAVFYKDRDVSYQVLDLQDTCVVPAAALSEKGALYISVFGFNAEGVVRTSEVLRYEVKEGAVVSAPEPEATVYEQIMVQYAEAMALLKDTAAITAVKYDVEQNLSEAQKERARRNIGAGQGNGDGTVTTIDGIGPDTTGAVALSAVRYEAQGLTAAQMRQVRENIGAGTVNPPSVATALPASGTALAANTIYKVSAPVGAHAFIPPTTGWACGRFITAENTAVTFADDARFVGAAPSFEPSSEYEFDVNDGVWVVQKVVRA